MNAKNQNNYKTIFSLRVHLELQKRGFEYILEKDNIYKPGLKCWVYKVTPAFNLALNELLGGK